MFENNVAEDGAGIYISDHSTVMFGENSNTKFINNTVYHNGAAIFLHTNCSAIFDNNSTLRAEDGLDWEEMKLLFEREARLLF